MVNSDWQRKAPLKHGTDQHCGMLYGAVWPDWMIRAAGIFTPFVNYGESPPGKISYGVTSGGYDIRLQRGVKVFYNLNSAIIDPKATPEEKEKAFIQVDDQVVTLPPNSYLLANSVERIKVPRECLGACWGKSTYARSAIIANLTPLEPGWEGHLVIEVANGTTSPAKIYTEEGICQIVFFELRAECERSYPEKPNPKYQNQPGDRITLAKV